MAAIERGPSGVAVVFGGGGVVGLAWELGVVDGLREGGFDAARADLIVGTSAGSIVGALLASGETTGELIERGFSLAPELAALMAPVDEDWGRRIYDIWHAAGMTPGPDERRAIGRMALEAPTTSEDTYLRVFGQLLPKAVWTPSLTVTSVSVTDGAAVRWTATSGVPLVRCLAASCALPGVFPPVSIDGQRFVDGGVRSPLSADLAVGQGRVVVIAPDASDAMRFVAEQETAAARLAGADVSVILPDGPGQEAIGADYMDLGRADGAYSAGARQGASEAADVVAAEVRQGPPRP